MRATACQCSSIHALLEPQSQDEILYCADTPIDSCGYLEGEDPCDCSVVTYGDSDQDGESDDEQADENYGGRDEPRQPWLMNDMSVLEWQTSPSLPGVPADSVSPERVDDNENDDDGIEDSQKEMQSLL